MLAIQPGERFFLPKGFLSPLLSEDQLTGCRLISGSSPDLPLTVSFDRGEIEVTNPWPVSVGLMEVRVIHQLPAGTVGTQKTPAVAGAYYARVFLYQPGVCL